jgi:hypothetical protein
MKGIYTRTCTLGAHDFSGHHQATHTVVEPAVVGAGTGSPWSRSELTCRGMASAISFSTSSRVLPTATQPGRSGTYAPQASPSCSITTTYSVTLVPSRPACLPPDRRRGTPRHLVTEPPGDGHGTGPVRVTELAMRARLPLETPSLPLQDPDHFPGFHALTLTTACDRVAALSRRTAAVRVPGFE